MATMRDIYEALKAGECYYQELHDGHKWDVLFIGVDDRWNSPSYGKEYIYWNHYGSSADTVSLKNLSWIITHIFGMNANQFLATYKTY